MPFFSYPVDPHWLLTLVSGILMVSSTLFRFLQAIHLWGALALATIIVALFARNLMGPYRA